ncbi:MAG: double-strand break repair helicase AddA [Rhizobiales bacterium NRL2]|jgi:ATP-dependent helicase/nuclease subunit A|nr:MAG: double-strand break repair helicase AddA [Rhizobiales bacterium NRL2]
MTAAADPLARTIAAQRKAARPDASAWVSANAGSGKTRVLTDRVIRLMLEQDAPPNRILSITFTNAAAAEMSNRLFRRLGEWAALPDDVLTAKLTELLGEAGAARQPLDLARRLFARALETPGGLKVQTIHAFAQSVLGRFPLEAGLSPEFRLMDEAEAHELLERLKHTILAGRSTDREVDAALERLIDRMADGAFDELLRAALNARRAIEAAIARHGGVDGVVAEIRSRFGLRPDEDEAAVTAAGCAFGAWDELGLRRVLAGLRRDGGKKAAANADLIEAWLASDDDARQALLADYRGVFLTQKGEPRKTLIPAAVAKADPGALAVMEAELGRIMELTDRCAAAACADRTADLLRLAGALLADYAAEKQRLALVDYDDLIRRTLGLLRSQAAWVHFKLDEGLDHILIDEAQDTSPDQWRIAELLSAEFFAGEGARADVVRTVFAVGDEKQSIYSFQGADPEGFDRMRGHFRERALDARESFEDVSLDVSFRSAPEILTAVDRTFAGPAGAGLTAGGAASAHIARRAGAQGLVELWPLEAPGESEEQNRWDAPMDTERPDSPRRRLAVRIAERIAAMIRDRETIGEAGDPDRPLRAITPGDVLILVRRRDATVAEIARELKRLRVPVAGADRMVLTEQIAVMDLMALGDFLLLPEDDLTLATVLKSPLYGFDDDDLFQLAHGREKHERLWRVLRQRADERPRWAEAAAELRDLLARADQSTPFAFFAELLGAGGARRRLLARLGTDQLDPLDEFLNAALDDERRHPPSLQGFLHRLRAGQSAEIRRDMERGGGAVRIMTVHGAKGLEAPVVILPDTTRAPRSGKSPLIALPGPGGDEDIPVMRGRAAELPDRIAQQAEREQERGLAEYNRLLYVAMTRAEERLYVCGFYNSERALPDDASWYRAVEGALAEIGETDADGVLRHGRGAPALTDDAGAADETEDLPAWATAPAPAEPAPPRPLAPSRQPGEEPDAEPAALSPLQRTGGAGRRRGVLVHHLLQVLPELPPGRREDAGASILARRAADLEAAERAALLAEALGVIAAPEMAAAFAPGSRAEAAIAGVIGGHVVSGQVDRLAVTNDSVLIVDYKTNRPPPQEVAGVPLAYLRQMALYRAVMRRIHPDREVRCALVWTVEARLMALPAERLDHALASLDLSQAAT